MDDRILLENQKPGTARSIWDAPATNQIEGFATQISVDNGSTISFKINLNVPVGGTAPYNIEIYRLGYYGGDGATLVTQLTGLTGIRQPNPVTDSRGVVDAGNWSVSASWATPADAVSGVYLAKLVRTDNGQTNQIPFIVRDDGGHSDIVLQTSDTTWQAYNGWAGRNGQVGASLYGGFDQPANIAPDQAPADQDRAFAVSYNRPIITRDGGGTYAGGQDYLFGADYAAIYWLERNGYDVSYISGVDTDRLGVANLTNHLAYISVGHDEYWSGGQRANVEAARDLGVNLLFWSGNEVYWKTRWEGSISDGTPFRTLVTYKETRLNYSLTAGPEDYANVDPSNEWTGTWRDLRFVDAVGPDGVTHTAVGAKPENALTGQLFGPDGTGEFGGAIDVPAQFAAMRDWRDTGIGPGGAQDLAPGILGYEWDVSPIDDFRPPTLIKLSESTVPWSAILTDQGNREAPGIATHNLSIYRAPSGALVFGAGTVFWSWGLSNQHDSSPYGATIQSTALQQFAVNMFADMNIQPAGTDATLQAQGLVRASASNDHIAATATLNDLPATVNALAPITISGTAADIDNNPTNADGRVALVEVSLDGGQTWKVAQGVANWSFNWTPITAGAYTIKARAIDDSLNVLPGNQLATDVVNVTMPAQPDTVSLFSSVTPTGQLFNDGAAVELGMKFRATVAGSVTQLSYFRNTGDANDTDVRAGHLWSSTGTLLGTVTFNSGPGQSGWQVATLTTPVQIQPGDTYVVSYKTADNYQAAENYFTTTFTEPFGVLTAPASSLVGGNGVFAYGSALQFPTDTFSSTNYWVDVTFDPAGGGNSAPVFTSSANFSVPENGTVVGTVTATDADNNPLTFAIVGGSDQGAFTINATTGQLQFVTAPDFEAPTDAGADNHYALTVSVTDSVAPPVQQAITVTVTDVPETPQGSATFAGRSIRAEYIFGSAPDTLFPANGASQTATVVTTPGSVEFTNVPFADPVNIGNGAFGLATADLTDQTVRIQFPLDPGVFSQTFVPFATVQDAPFNGLRLTDADGLLPAIRGVSIISQNGFTNAGGVPTPLTAADFTVTSDGIFLNVAGKGRLVDADSVTPFVQPTEVVVSVNLNDAPVADPETLSTAQGAALQIPAATLLAGDTDADGDALTISAVNGAVNGTATFDAATNIVTFTPTAGFAGTASFNYVVIDGFGGSATGAVTVNVTSGPANPPPTVTPINAGTTNEDAAPVDINLLAGAADPNLDPLSVQNLTVASSNAARTVNFSVSPAGVLTLNPSQFNNLAQGASETITATYSVSDGVNAVPNTATLVMQGVNDAPVAANDAFATGEATVLAGNVITNGPGQDTDPDGNTLSVVAVNGSGAGVGVPVTLPSGARLTLNASGAFSYDPNGAFDALNTGQTATDSFTYTVSDGIAPATATASITINGVSSSNQVLTGNNNANTLSGAAGNDSISGLGGADQLSGNGGRDTIGGGSGNDTADGGAGDDVLLIRAGEGQFDTLIGGDGTDTLRVDPAGGAAVLNGTGAISTVEVFDGGGQAVRGNGNANVFDFSGFTSVVGVASVQGLGGSDTLTGTGGPDALDGGSGADQVNGGGGDDILTIRGTEGQSDTVNGGAGTDTLRVDAAGGAVTLAGTGMISSVEVFNGNGQGVRGTSGSNVLDFSGFTSVVGVASISGLGGSDTLTGTGGPDVLDGGGGADQVNGGDGDDTILIRGTEAQSDTLTGGVGTDTLRVDAAGGPVTLAGTGTISTIEVFDGSGQAVRGTGSANVLDFSAFTSVVGVTSISGLGGNDTLTGTGGADVMIGGTGADRLIGGAGDDVFSYAAFNESTSASRDVIVDFTGAGVVGGDVIDVSALVAGQFAFNGTGGFSGGGVPSIRYVNAGGVTDVQFDSGFGGAAEMIVRINGVVTLSAGDFLL